MWVMAEGAERGLSLFEWGGLVRNWGNGVVETAGCVDVTAGHRRGVH